MVTILKKFFLLAIMSLGVVLHLGAQEIKVVSTGQGTTEDEATKTALRSALEDAYGAFISSSTKIENDVLVSDEIVSLTQGNIKEYDVVNSSQLANGLYSVTVESVVSLNELATYCQNKGMSVSFNGKVFGMDLKMKEFNRQNEIKILKNLCLQLLAMNPQICDYDLKAASPKVSNIDLSLEYSPMTGFSPYAIECWVKEHNANIYVPILVLPKVTSNYKLIAEFMETTITSIAMTKQEKKSYDKIKLKYHETGLYDDDKSDYYFRDDKAIEIAKEFFFSFRKLITQNWILKDGVQKNVFGTNLDKKTLSSLGIVEKTIDKRYVDSDFGITIANGHYPTSCAEKFYFYYSEKEVGNLQLFEIIPFNEEAYATIIKPKLLGIISKFDNIN